MRLLPPPVAPGPPAPKPLDPPPVAPELLMTLTTLKDAGREGDDEGDGEGPPEPIKLLASAVLSGPPNAWKPDSPPVAPEVEMMLMGVSVGVLVGPPDPCVLTTLPVPAGPPDTMKKVSYAVLPFLMIVETPVNVTGGPPEP